MSEKYYRVCTHLKDKGILLKEGDSLEKYKKGEAYVSAFRYNKDHKKLFTEKGSVAGISDVTTDIIYFDLDNADLEVARQDTIKVLDRLKEYGVSNTTICLSGSKGYHLALHTTTSFSPIEARTLAVNLAGDLSSFDSSIYNANRLIRIEGSVHQKTGLRKTRVSEQELRELKIADLKSLATKEYEYSKPAKETLTEPFLSLSKPIIKESSAEISLTEGVDYFSNPYKLQPWKLALSQGFFPNGNRSNSLMILAATLKNKELSKTQCYYALKAAADLQAERYGKEK